MLKHDYVVHALNNMVYCETTLDLTKILLGESHERAVTYLQTQVELRSAQCALRATVESCGVTTREV